MNRIDRMFQEKAGSVLSVYMTAGYPLPDDTVEILSALQDSGVDMVEIGMPFSDPLADGPVIQQSSQVALRNGMSLERLFEQLEGIRERINIPLVLMGYLNPVLRMGMDRFLSRCREVGIDGLILPDLPPEEYEQCYAPDFRAAGIHHILLVSPQTSPERLVRLADLSGGFLYMVADTATTGGRGEISAAQLAYFRRMQEADLPLPGLIGFGISNRETFETASRYARGAIIGSAFIRALDGPGAVRAKVESFVASVTGSTGSRQ